jgi:DNA-binding transcriptional ArsR family regulator
MKSIHLVDTLPALRALSDALRMAVIRELRAAPKTVSQLAALLREPANKLHYHVTELEKHGLVEVVETRQKGNLLEKYYRASAEFFRVDPHLFDDGPEALEAHYENVVSLLDTTAMELRRAMQAGRITASGLGEAVRTLLYLKLSPEEAVELRERLGELIREFREKSRPEAAQGVALTVLMFPFAAPTRGEEAVESPDGEREK